MNVLALEFPPVNHLFDWPSIAFEGTPFALNKVGLTYLFAMVATMAKRYVSPTLFSAKGVPSNAIDGQSNRWLTGGNSRARTFMLSAPRRDR
jgi:hypothetical protein